MLIQYSVKNYKSIKNDIVINFSATSNNIQQNLVLNSNSSTPIYKTLGLVGPNASGKSNILESLYFALKFINSTIKRKSSEKIPINRFLLDTESNDHISSFEFIFIQKNIKYVYGFSISETRIEEEYLMAYYTKKPTTVFDRSFHKENIYDFKSNDIKVQSDISKKTNVNRLYLPVAAEWGYEKAKEPYIWFENAFKQYGNLNMPLTVEKIVKNESSKEFLLKSLRKADFNVSNIFVKRKKMETQQRDAFYAFISQLIGEGEFDKDIIPEETPVVWVTHQSADGNEFSIELDNDSSGTKDIIYNVAEFLYVNNTGGLIIEDELGRNYHRMLTKYYINLFNDTIQNRGNAQMIFSTHDTTVLKLLNPDQIYLVDKDETGATYVKLLDDYLIREKDNIELGYLKGRYGAIPNIKK